jgi:hypothetical protein
MNRRQPFERDRDLPIAVGPAVTSGDTLAVIKSASE